MCAALIGGMDRLQSEYKRSAKAAGWQLRCISRNERDFQEKIGSPDLVIIFTNKVSHEAMRKAVFHARRLHIRCEMIHSCGVCTLRECLRRLS